MPLNVGGRLTGRAGRYSVGVLNIQTGDRRSRRARRRPTSASIRVKRDVLRRSSVGLLFTNRSVSTIGTGANRSYGIDGTFAFFENLQINTYWARTDTDGLSTQDNTSYRGQLDYSGDRYTVQLERLKIGDNFNPEMGFLRRDDMVRDYARFRFSPRPRNRSAIRKYVYDGVDRVHRERRRAPRVARARGGIRARVPERRSLQRQLHELVRVPAGALPRSAATSSCRSASYQFDTFRVGYNIGQQRLVSANLTAEFGTFYNGHKTSFSAARGRVPITNQLSVEPTYSFNHVTLDAGTSSPPIWPARA